MYWVKYIRYSTVFSAYFTTTGDMYEFLCILDDNHSVKKFKFGEDGETLNESCFGWEKFSKSSMRLYENMYEQ